LRNLTGEVNANGTVTFFATTSTSSDSGDNGADPNEIVKIIDVLGDTSLPTGETFSCLRPAFVLAASPSPLPPSHRPGR
jgi:hypothetical protein